MPQFSWTGIDLLGTTQRGTITAPSPHDVEKYLFEHRIAPLSIRPQKIWRVPSLSQPWHINDTLAFFQALSSLLAAGVFLSDALTLLKEQSKNQYAKTLITSLQRDICAGLPLSTALEKYPEHFNALIIAMIRTGQETGKLALSCNRIYQHVRDQQSFHAAVRSALTAPLITLIFFIIATIIIIGFIVPQFEQLFLDLHQPLPTSLTIALFIRNHCTSFSFSIIGALALITGLITHRYRIVIRSWYYQFASYLPFIKDLVLGPALLTTLQTIGLLLEHGVSLNNAITIAHDVCDVPPIKSHLHHLRSALYEGTTFSQAFTNCRWIPRDLTSIIALGEESGQLGPMISYAAAHYKHHLQKTRATIATLTYPLALILVGILVALLVISIYVPLQQCTTLPGH